ncbi:MAG: lipoprotein [Pseudoxanthomonas sp.]
MTTFLRFALASSVLVLLAGCGAKGPLILPEKAAPIEAPADEPTDNTPQIDAPAPTPADEQAEDAVEDPVPPATDE